MEQRWAALDLGTNSTLLLSAGERGGHALRPTVERYRTTRLGEGLGQTGGLLPDAIERTVSAAVDFREAATSEPNTRGIGVTVATSAARDATNGSDFTDACQAALGHCPIILTGEEEAAAVFRGASSDHPRDAFVVSIDIGGGSTELSAGPPARCVYSASVNAGCVRHGERFGLYGCPNGVAVSQAEDAIRAILAPHCAAIHSAQAPGLTPLIIVSGGTASTLAALTQELTAYAPEKVHGWRSGQDALRTTREWLWSLSTEERAQVPGMEPGRASVLPTGLLILEMALELLKCSDFMVTTRGLRFGLSLLLREGRLAPTWRW
ncbi:MAG: hypothetical protein HN742_11950 [Lentisphaerae bacterium]|jgi:exopolyphosphatase / guanosine-5'-triphosphate,3'-diphosphate pyrophosphatase|nr:hypothetical protein [Lentisphaerota bacterium]MBT4819289.1 hypothetical protein [Lentisphaerota bacterium]MBT5610541.1 hypothetical protein [Lentisphaerota bacterium]MBT7054413.1 hypothetical protein [Lentisphaerota bacterium]MBT7842582.1 hypothetical protein [Lentisphaerota bacterium]